jgi:hypothetical protein
VTAWAQTSQPAHMKGSEFVPDITHTSVAVGVHLIGRSRGRLSSGAKREIAAVVHGLIAVMGLEDVTLVGHDIGGMVAYAYLREFRDLRRAVIMDVPIPGVDPWEDFIRQPFLWHFALHAVPELPEQLVTGREREYLGYFYDLLSAHPGLPSLASRAEQIAAYESVGALAAGFEWYRALAGDTEHNQAMGAGPPIQTPLLYLRGEKERGGALELRRRTTPSRGRQCPGCPDPRKRSLPPRGGRGRNLAGPEPVRGRPKLPKTWMRSTSSVVDLLSYPGCSSHPRLRVCRRRKGSGPAYGERCGGGWQVPQGVLPMISFSAARYPR